ncbi:MAG: rod shape-determining protein RodA [Phycisphaerales bacterium]|nr:MAG: rod shape-determining protein RodA [Phycisphaerales bacterium]
MIFGLLLWELGRFCDIFGYMYNFLQGRLVFVRICLLTASLALVAVGIVSIYAVGNPAEPSPTGETERLSGYWQKQVVFAAIAAIGYVAINLISYRRLGTVSYWAYGLVLLLLAVLLVSRYIVPLPFVPERNGTHRWIIFELAGWDLPALQPSEICKIAYILALAWYLRYRSNYRSLKVLIGPFALTLLPMMLILAEPDLGTVLLMMPILFTMLFVAGAKVRHLLLIILLAVLVSPLLWGQMDGQRRRRISSVLLQSRWLQDKAEQHPKLGKILVGRDFSKKAWKNDWGFHLIRSKFAVASGGKSGYGFRRGPFVKYDFLPERHNDFIFASIAHQSGFYGCLGLLALYAVVVGCGLEIAVHNTDAFARLTAVGIVAMFVVEVLVNVNMTVGLMPITGLTLPLVSYGGSSLLVNSVCIGLLNNIGRSRPFSVAPKSFE